MSNSKAVDRQEWLRIQDALADAVEQASERELREDLHAAGRTAEDESRRFRTILDRAKLAAGRKRLAQARDAVQADSAYQRPSRRLDSVSARIQLKHIVANDPSLGTLMLAARNAGTKGIDELSDNDVQILLEMAEELGHGRTDGAD